MIEALVIIVIIGVVVWFVNQYVPMSPPFKTAMNIAAAIIALVLLLRALGIWHGGPRL